MRILILPIVTLLIGCGKTHVPDNLEPYHFEVIAKDIGTITKINSLSQIKDNVDNLREIQSTYCAYASETYVRYMIAEELILERSIINMLLTPGNRITESGSIHPHLTHLETFRKLDSASMDKVLDGLDKSSASQVLKRKVPKLKLAIKQGYDNQTEATKMAAIEIGTAINCGMSSINLFIVNQDESDIVSSTLQSVLRQAMVSSLSD
jgi:hypothetical protein